MLPKAAYGLACDLFDGIAAAAELTAVKESRTSAGEVIARAFALAADTAIETRDYGVMTVAELERLVRRARATGRRRSLLRHLPRPNASADRLSPDQLGPLRPRHLRHHDGNDWHRRERAPSARFEFRRVPERKPFR